MTSDLSAVTIGIAAIVLMLILEELGDLSRPAAGAIVAIALAAYGGVWIYRWRSYKRA